MKKNKWWGVTLATACAVASLAGPGSVGDAHAAYIDCTMCHLDPAPGSPAKDYFDYFATPQRQHPTGRAYPTSLPQEFFLPTALVGDIVFFDRNGNGIADADEVQLFGTGAKVECASCHREHGDAPPPPQPNMYLRMSAAMLCMVCHRT
jgi:predicted CXXCH cytochrome family protein